jgi:hypothetical protein
VQTKNSPQVDSVASPPRVELPHEGWGTTLPQLPLNRVDCHLLIGLDRKPCGYQDGCGAATEPMAWRRKDHQNSTESR